MPLRGLIFRYDQQRKEIYIKKTKLSAMLNSVTGNYINGQIKLNKCPPNIQEGTEVIVTFITSDDIDLSSQGISQEDAQKLRNNLKTFADDWNSPDMSIYDNYEQNKANLETL